MMEATDKEFLLFKLQNKSQLNKSTGCIEWTGTKDKNFGKIKYRGKQILVHRLAYEIYIDTVPDNLMVLHSCGNNRCVNPKHLKLGTYLDNHVDRMMRKCG